ncbi:hypothetical protein AJ85_06200 [Alkalihalobacillus alcalophilus ATCC 27647 = CGMCC 1.3604]|uniref:YbyB n=1 Tax=Alkalihalobacillus alcalophilus ATCC 27647 = CGMCC 1.3604 TaxID=1218173 RepID=A0A094WHU8_ALKAL|nr:hypothetical protein [Alkalihalobacillus alcalophilus]KGA97364.1 hypothetical protein BALCAV_0210660 [Alkalihalobacillus alcalophilus ATCC 27647 = CGMCC 1.3604]MED1562094.1 hypothetical protein [Alkalihalobacillus alcalophilus]THG88366.1 hypothetical protein AJ85_06200 [Alkalihalobacillus alcalophilus ATCC 27647 = CGMCC 1.3604]
MGYKKAIYATLVAGASAVTTFYLTNKERRTELKNKTKEMYQKVCSVTNKEKPTPKQLRIGHPDPYDIEDQKMVDEGALYSVQRYNRQQ